MMLAMPFVRDWAYLTSYLGTKNPQLASDVGEDAGEGQLPQ
jgi:hypothetical protein